MDRIWFCIYDDFSELTGRETQHLRCKFLQECYAREYLEFIRAKYPGCRFVLYRAIQDKLEKLEG